MTAQASLTLLGVVLCLLTTGQEVHHCPQAEIVGQPGMAEEEYQAAVAQTAQLAAQLPRIGVAARPTPGPSMPQRMINRFRNQEAVLGMIKTHGLGKTIILCTLCHMSNGMKFCSITSVLLHLLPPESGTSRLTLLGSCLITLAFL